MRRSADRLVCRAERGVREGQQLMVLTRQVEASLATTLQRLEQMTASCASLRTLIDPQLPVRPALPLPSESMASAESAQLAQRAWYHRCPPSPTLQPMPGSTFGELFRVTNFGESHGPAIGCVIDGCPPGMALSEADIQGDLDRRRPGTSRHVTQRNEADAVEILSGVYEGLTTGTPIALLIRNTDQRSKDYGNILDTFRPGHADYTYWRKYGLRDPRGGGRASARLTAPTVAAGAVAQEVAAAASTARASSAG